jgi:SpoVK/Ycf46/Vps4 family AAA+-type ATPase
MRDVRDMQPERLKAMNEIGKFAEIFEPGAAEQPILAANVRAAVHQWLMELNSEAELKKAKLKPRRTAMLSGPPGCGKTTLAHHLAARLGLPLAVVSMDKIVGVHVGESSRNIGQLFGAMTAVKGRMVLLMDEFDAIATERTKDDQAAAREMNAIVVSLLQYIDRHDGTIIAATNLADRIDRALWRRFGLQIEIALPDGDARFAILKRYLAPYAWPDEVVDILVELTAGATPALLRQLMENVKRALVLWPKFQLDLTARTAFAAAVGSIQPHAEMPAPPLWADPETALELLGQAPWPPVLEKQKEPA